VLFEDYILYCCNIGFDVLVLVLARRALDANSNSKFECRHTETKGISWRLASTITTNIPSLLFA